MKKIDTRQYSIVFITRRIFSYGILFMIPLLFFLPFQPDLKLLSNPIYSGNILYLGIGACAICFAIWNYALKVLGTMTASVYIYAVPVVTIIASSLLLDEVMTPAAVLGSLLTLVGLIISENKLSLQAMKKYFIQNRRTQK